MGRRLVALIGVVVLLVGACGAQRPTLDSSDGVAREATPTTTPTSDPVDSSVDPLTIRLAVPGTWTGDPADAGPASISNRVLADLLFEGLVRLDTSGAPVPGLAVSWATSDDRLTWTFFLPDDLVDGQGFAVHAADVAESLNHVARRGPADQVATALVAVTGWQDAMGHKADSVAGIQAVDDVTLEIHLDHPFELLPSVLAAPGFGVVVAHPDGTVGTTGRFRPTKDPNRLESVSPSFAVRAVELIPDNGDVGALIAGGAVDWAVVPPETQIQAIPGDLIRAPLDLRVGFEIRMSDRSRRVGVLELIDAVSVAEAVPGLSAVVMPPLDGPSARPTDLVIDAPSGRLAEVARAVADRLEAADVSVDFRVSSPTDFAGRVASGEATVFPITIAGGTGVGGSTIRFFSTGGLDNWTGFDSTDSESLLDRAVSEIDSEARAAVFPEIESDLAESGFVFVIGRWEVNVFVGRRVQGLRQRGDGTLDLSEAVLATAQVDGG